MADVTLWKRVNHEWRAFRVFPNIASAEAYMREWVFGGPHWYAAEDKPRSEKPWEDSPLMARETPEEADRD